MLWQNEPTVVIGKNQNAFVEINREYTDKNGIHIARRITGGGAVYHDLGNLNYTFISKRSEKGSIDFEYFTRPIISALKSLSVYAVLSGRNDILVDGKKISGNAQYSTEDRTLHHGTLLFDSDLGVLSDALCVDEAKMKSKAIKSARSRVTNIKPLLSENITLERFIETIKDFVIQKYAAEEIEPPINEIVKSLEERNSSTEWIFPENSFISNYSIIKRGRFDFGGVEIHLDMSNDIINSAKIFGDFFGIKSVLDIENIMAGKRIFDIKDSISSLVMSEYILGMTNEEFINLLIHG